MPSTEPDRGDRGLSPPGELRCLSSRARGELTSQPIYQTDGGSHEKPRREQCEATAEPEVKCDRECHQGQGDDDSCPDRRPPFPVQSEQDHDGHGPADERGSAFVVQDDSGIGRRPVGCRESPSGPPWRRPYRVAGSAARVVSRSDLSTPTCRGLKPIRTVGAPEQRFVDRRPPGYQRVEPRRLGQGGDQECGIDGDQGEAVLLKGPRRGRESRGIHANRNALRSSAPDPWSRARVDR